MFSQEQIYDERYRRGVYDERSAVRVLTAEKNALATAARRALESVEDGPLTLLDFGYGTGRTTNEFMLSYAAQFGRLGRDLHVVAYDVSAVGLAKAAAELGRHDFAADGDFKWQPGRDEGYVAGRMTTHIAGVGLQVSFVHGSELDDATRVRKVLLEANGLEEYLVTTSWYSALGHIHGADRRRAFFTMLADLTHSYGELVVAVSATGDLVEAQQYWRTRLRSEPAGTDPVEVDGDVLYVTELGQQNFWHVFSEDLTTMLQGVRSGHQHAWIEAIRFPADEFADVAAEQDNYRNVRAKNVAMAGKEWRSEDFDALHTVAAVRSGHRHGRPREGYSGVEVIGGERHPDLVGALISAGEAGGRP